MRVMNSLYVQDFRARIGLQKGALLITGSEGSKTRVPLAGLEAVVLVGGGQMTTDALARCVERNIRVSALRRSGKVRFVVGGPTGGNVHLRVAQVDAARDESRCLAIARSIVAGKIQNSRRLMQRWIWDSPPNQRSELEGFLARVDARLGGLPSAPTGDAIRGVEGDAARWYFQALSRHVSRNDPAVTFTLRTRRPPRDPINALLSFVYALILTEITGALESVGLDPQLGFLHGMRPGRASLALDLLEEFRPSVADRFVVRLVNRRQIGEKHFVSTAGGACYLSDDGRRLVLEAYEESKDEVTLHPLLRRSVPRWTLPQVQATLMARHLRGDLPVYPPFVMEP